ncbi:unnamed protein product [Brassicogethes aeneus]|uniref:Uncharacterized protein n=1 Tax=Brassicogethes aeneus TaxID=1431903 RepID=A0A9P0FMH3_BRAAE|nr:unnamed protein product [Brassicogethes aeneus]
MPGSFLSVAGDLGSVSKTTACKTIRRVSLALVNLRDRYTYMPQNNKETLELKSCITNSRSGPGMWLKAMMYGNGVLAIRIRLKLDTAQAIVVASNMSKTLTKEQKVEKRRRQKRLFMQKGRANIYNDPEKHDDLNRNRRAQYKEKKDSGEIKKHKRFKYKSPKSSTGIKINCKNKLRISLMLLRHQKVLL